MLYLHTAALGIILFLLPSVTSAQQSLQLPDQPTDEAIVEFFEQLREDVGPASQAVPPRMFNAYVAFYANGTALPNAVKESFVTYARRFDAGVSAESCDEAAFWVYLFLQTITEKRDELLSSGTEVLTEEEKSKFRHVMAEYDRLCLIQVSSIDDRVQNLGVITNDRVGVVCTGRLIDSRTFLSAQHCMSLFDGTEHIEMFIDPSHERIAIQGREEFRDPSDLLVIHLSQEFAGFQPSGGTRFEDVSNVGPALDSPVYLKLLDISIEGDSWRDAVRRSNTDDVDSCVLAVSCRSGLHFIHGCQTDERSSGATLLNRGSGLPVGRHLGTGSIFRCTASSTDIGTDIGGAAFANRGVIGNVDNQLLNR